MDEARFSEDFGKRLIRGLSQVEGWSREAKRTKTFRPNIPKGTCRAYQYLWTIRGQPTAGNIKIYFLWANENIGFQGVETITVDFDDTVDLLQNKIRDLDGVGDPKGVLPNIEYAEKLGVGVTGTGGNFPTLPMRVRLTGSGKGGKLLEMNVFENNLTGGVAAHIEIDPILC